MVAASSNWQDFLGGDFVDLLSGVSAAGSFDAEEAAATFADGAAVLDDLRRDLPLA